MRTLAFIAAVFLCCIAQPMHAQGTAGENATSEPRFIVDMPTAGVLSRLHHSVGVYAFPEGGVMLEWSIAPFNEFNVGISYGGSGVIGAGIPDWQPWPGLHAKYRIIAETLNFPAITVGFSSQGRGAYLDGLDKFVTQSPGLYAVASKSFVFLGRLDLHGGVNYAFEGAADDRSPNIYVGLEKSVGNIFSAAIEYNATFMENLGETMRHRGLLNASIRCSIGKGFTLEFQARDLLTNFRNADHISRSLALEYIEAL